MRIFVTGASGWIGSAVVPELLAAGHQVVGLARSDELGRQASRRSAPRSSAASLDDLDACGPAAADSDGVVHLGYNHDFSRDGRGGRRPTAPAIEPSARRSRHRPAAAHRLGHARAWRPGGSAPRTTDPTRPSTRASPTPTLALGAGRPRRALDRRAASRRPCTADGDHGFIAVLVGIAREQGRLGLRRRRRQPLAGRAPPRRRPRWCGWRSRRRQPASVAARRGRGGRAGPRHRRGDRRAASTCRWSRSRPSEAAEHFGWIGALLRRRRPGLQRPHPRALGWQPDQPDPDRGPRRRRLLLAAALDLCRRSARSRCVCTRSGAATART